MIKLGPGLHQDVSNEDYHRDPVEGGSLSSSGARDLLPPSCPALFQWKRTHGSPPKATFDFGHAAHRAVLDEGETIEYIDAPDWRTKAAKEQREQAREAGKVPLLDKERETVEAMADAIRAHPVASALLATDGRAEQTIVWQDQRTGINCRARIDWLPNPTSGRLLITDYKSCNSAEPEAISRAVHDYGYHQQGDFYTQGAIALGLGGPETAFVFIFQEKKAPYLVTVCELDHAARTIGASRNRWAMDTYAQCEADGHWPAYSDDVEIISLPPWAEKQEGIL